MAAILMLVRGTYQEREEVPGNLAGDVATFLLVTSNPWSGVWVKIIWQTPFLPKSLPSDTGALLQCHSVMMSLPMCTRSYVAKLPGLSLSLGKSPSLVA